MTQLFLAIAAVLLAQATPPAKDSKSDIADYAEFVKSPDAAWKKSRASK